MAEINTQYQYQYLQMAEVNTQYQYQYLQMAEVNTQYQYQYRFLKVLIKEAKNTKDARSKVQFIDLSIVHIKE